MIQKASATHSMGADLTYRCLGGNTYEITLSFYRDCIGVMVEDSAYVLATSSCQGNYYTYLPRVAGTGQEITPLCPSEVSTCNGGTFTGIQEYVFQRTVILPGQCSDWTFSYNQCCRNNAITNITTPGSWQMYVYATLNNLITPCNNSPTFSNKPVPFVCQGQQFCFNHGAYDTDGDSLVYTLITPWDSPGLPISYMAGFSASNPLTSNPIVTFNPFTGDICMTPTNLEVTVMAVLVEEYRNGVLIGSVERDIQVTVIACTNQVPTLTGMNGSNNFSMTACAGIPFCFTISSGDTDVAQSTAVNWDNAIPGASFTITPGNRESATFCWTPTAADISATPHCFTASVLDNNCPVFGSQTFSYCITVEGVQVTVPNIVVGCNATTNLAASATGGQGGYNYSWSTGATTQSISAGPGNYTVTVTDGICTTSTTATVSQSQPASATVASSPVTCYGGNNGSATVTPTAGSPPFTYSWSPAGGTGTMANNLAAGNYTVTVTDANGCTTQLNTTVTQPTQLVAAASSNPASCNGGSDGSVSVVPNGGIAGYNFSWSPSGGTGSTVNGLAAGNYTVTVTDVNGCTTQASTMVIEPTMLTAAASANPVSCNGGSDGSASVLANGGTASYTFVWSPSGGTSATANNLSAGNYSVTVTDANGCTAQATTSVTQPLPLYLGASSNPVVCFGGTDGSASVAVFGGTAAYTYLWAPSGGTSSSANSLSAGNYTVTVTDANGCTAQANTTVTQPTLLTAAASSNPVSCNGGSNGSASVFANGGTTGYTYSWSPSGGTGSTANGLSASNYDVTVTDANGCTAQANTTVTQPPLLTAAASSNPVSCNGGSNGSASVIANGGTTGYTYSWSPSGGTGSTANGLAAGNYVVTVTDANGCTAQANTTVTQPTLLTAAAASNPVSCNGGSNGSASVIANGGMTGYTYSWSPNGGTGSTANGLSAGNYIVTVMDANGCTAQANTMVNEPTLLTAAASSTPVLCNGGNDGSVSVVTNGGMAGYTFSWSPSGGTGSTANGLSAGNYMVTVTDANGCTALANTMVSEPTLLTAAASSNPVSCNGGSNGSASVVTNGGTSGYAYSWSPNGGTASTANGLSAGNYIVTVTDANGCIAQANTTVSEPALLTAAASSNPVSCNSGSDGSASVFVNGGTSGFSYVWAPLGGTNATANGLTAGMYTVTVTDANGCTVSTNTLVTEPTLLTASFISTAVHCFGGADGSATATASNGTPGYSYTWPSGANGSTASGLAAGIYPVIITDANGCTTAINAVVTEPSQLNAIANSNSALCFGSSDGSVSVNASGGTGTYSFSWSPVGALTATVFNLPAGNYSVIVTDLNGCTASSSIAVSQPSQLSLSMSATPALCHGDASGSASVVAAGGTTAYAYAWFPSSSVNPVAPNLPAGMYSVTVTDAHGCTSMDSIPIGEPPAITLNTSSTAALCGSSNGSAGVVANGGSPPFQYQWFPSGGNASTANNLAAGAYTIVVTDANGCTSSSIANVMNTGGPAVTANVVATVSCHGGSDGSATVNVLNGTPPFNYAWAPVGGTGILASGLSAGNYSVTVTDANGCISSDNIIITEPSPVIVQASASATLCFGSADGNVSASAIGGTGSYLYSWSPGGATTSNASNLAAGNYVVTVTDANGCTATGSTVVLQPAVLNLTLTSSPALCNSSATGTTSVIVTGGTAGYTYNWSPANQSTQSAGNLLAGTYSVLVTDAHGCTSTDSIPVQEPQAMSLVTASLPAMCGAANGSASVNANGGTPPYNYNWLPIGGNNSTATGLTAGAFTVIVTDANGCTGSSQAMVSSFGGPLITTSQLPVSCYGGQDGSAVVNVTSGNPPYTFLWTPSGGNGAQASGLTAGNYSVVVSDVNGCLTATNVQIVEPLPITFSVYSTASTCGNANGSVAVAASGGTGALSYLWLPGNDTTDLVSNVSAGTYSLLISDVNGCSDSSIAVVNNIGGAVASLQSSGNVSCFGGADGFASIAVSGGALPYSYLWTTGETTDSVQQLHAGNYTVDVVDSAGCITTVQLQITEPPLLQTLMSSLPAGCNGAVDGAVAAAVSGGVAPYTYVWSPVSASDSMLSGVAAGTYSVIITDANGCMDSSGVAVTAPAEVNLSIAFNDVTCYGMSNGSASVTPVSGSFPFTYSWLPSGGNDATAQNLGPGNYQVTVIDSNGCSAIISAVIQEPTALALTVSPDVTLCIGQSTSLAASVSGGTFPYSFLWSNGATTSSQTVYPQGTQTYSVSVTDGNGCAISPQSVNVVLNPPLNLSATATPEICEGEPAQISATGGGGNGGPYSYSWNNGSILLPSATVFPPSDSAFTVILSDGCSPDIQMTVNIIVNPVPVANFLPQLIEGCMPVDASFTNHGSAPAGSVYHWDLGDGTFSDAENTDHLYDHPGHYNVGLTVTSPEGCTAQLSVLNAVIVHELPVAGFEMSDHEVSILTPSIEFYDGSSGVSTWSWDFGDASSSSEVNPIHHYQDTGSFTIQLIVENEFGCLDTMYARLRIVDDFTVFIPNAFTPNGDQSNDGFMAYGIGWKEFEMFIMDRWGLEIFHSSSKDRPWDGSFYGGSRKCQSDVYEYIIRITDQGDKVHQYLGHVTLVE